MRIRVKTLEELENTPNVVMQGHDIVIESTEFVYDMRRHCGKVIDVHPLHDDDEARSHGYTVQMTAEMSHQEYYYAPWMYEEIKSMNRNGANS